jgi:hypothetical protein
MSPITNPRLALANTAIALLPQLTKQKLVNLTPSQRSDAFNLAVACAREIMSLCDREGNAPTAPQEKQVVAHVTQPDVQVGNPEWIRLPKPNTRCGHTGLSRSTMNTLILPCDQNGFKPQVHSISLRRRGGKRGLRLINLSSLLDYIKSQMSDD